MGIVVFIVYNVLNSNNSIINPLFFFILLLLFILKYEISVFF